MVQFNQNELLFADRKIQFDYPIRKIVEFESLYVIMLQNGFSPENNILAYDINGNKVWSIEDVIHFSYNESYVALGRGRLMRVRVTKWLQVSFYPHSSISCAALRHGRSVSHEENDY